MKNQEAPTTRITKNGTSDISQEKPSPKTSDTIDPPAIKHTLYDFKDLVSQAKLDGEEWVETTAEIIKHFNPQGLKGGKYFIYDGVKVCEMGTQEAAQAYNDRDLQRDIFGPKEGINLVGNHHLHPGESTVK